MPEEEKTLSLSPISADGSQPDAGRSTGDQGRTRTGGTGGGSAGTELPPDSVPGYEILGPLGEGGMGVVWKARQVRLNRDVALKMVLGGSRAGPKELIRFLAEAEVTAAVKHPHVVQVYEFGGADGRPYLAMEYMPGGSLSDRLTGHGKFAPRDAAALMEKIARAVHAAHDLGIIHRDLKPANVLYDAAGEPKVTDFGLAKRGLGSDLTATRAVLGTPAYMAPEQAKGETKFVGPTADVFSLGVMLYECLTGCRPFTGERADVVISLIILSDPKPPRTFDPALPRDLETACLKCLEKDPARRYPSAKALADDLRAYLEGRPIAARPVGRLGRTVRWAKRNPGVAASLAAVAAALVAGTAVSVAFALEARARAADAAAEAARADAALTDAEREARNAREESTRADAETVRATDARAEAEREAAEARRLKAEADRERDRAEATAYAAQIGRAGSESRNGDAATAGVVLGTTKWDRRGWEFGHLARAGAGTPFILRGHGGVTKSVSFDPAGRRVASASSDGTVRIWDADSGTQLFAFAGHETHCEAVAFSPDGRRVASGGWDNAVRLWDADTGEEIRVFHGPTGFIRQVAFSPDGGRLAAASVDGSARVWDVAAGKELSVFKAHEGEVTGLAFAPDGRRIATSSHDGTCKIWDAATGRPVRTLTGHGSWVSGVCYSGDGKWLATASVDRTVRVWDAATGAERHVLRGHVHTPFRVAFTPDGTRLVSGSEDRSVILWDAATGQRLRTLTGHAGFVNDVAVSPDGRRLATVSEDATVRLWPLDDDAPGVRRLRGADGAVEAVAVSPDGRRILAGTAWGAVQVLDATTGGPLAAYAGRASKAHAVAYSPDGHYAAAAYEDGSVRIWDAGTGAAVRTFPGIGKPAISIAFGPDSRTLYSGTHGTGVVRVWTVSDWTEREPLRGHFYFICGLAVSPDGTRLASASADRTVKIWDTRTGLELATVRTENANHVFGAAFSPDGKWFAVATGDRSIKLWDAALREKPRTLVGHAGEVHSVNFSPDGTRLVSASLDGTVKIWDPAAGWEDPSRAELLTLRGHDGEVTAAVFSPDGRYLISGARDGSIVVRDGRFENPAFGVVAPGRVTAAEFLPDNRLLVRNAESPDETFDLPAGRPAGGVAPPIGPNVSPDGRFEVRVAGNRVRVLARAPLTAGYDLWAEDRADRARSAPAAALTAAAGAVVRGDGYAAAFHRGEFAAANPWDLAAQWEAAGAWAAAGRPDRAAAAVGAAVLTGSVPRPRPLPAAAGLWSKSAAGAVLAAAAEARQNKDAAAAARAFTEALRLAPDDARIRSDFAQFLVDEDRLEDAAEEFRRVVRLDPGNAAAAGQLGAVLVDLGDTRGGLETLRSAARLDPAAGWIRAALGYALRASGDLDAAEASYAEAVRLEPGNPRHERNLRVVRTWKEFARRLPGLKAGTDRPADSHEAETLALYCIQDFVKEYGLGFRYYTWAADRDPGSVTEHGYNTACAALLWAATAGPTAGLGPDEWYYLQHTARQLLAADLARNRSAAESPEGRANARQHLSNWFRDPDLAPFRDPTALRRLPDSERTAWTALWADAAATLRRAGWFGPLPKKGPPP